MRIRISQESIMAMLIIGMIVSASSIVLIALFSQRNLDSQFSQGYNQGYDEGFDDAVNENEPYLFNPVIDGEWNEEEGWDTNDSNSWAFAEYIIVGEFEHYSLTNYYYIHIEEGYLYILIDLVSDTTNNTDYEWVSVFIDGDNSQQYYYNQELWNEEEEDAHDSFCYHTETDEFYENTTLPYLDMGYLPQNWSTSLDENDVDIAFGFQSSKNGRIEHRIFEIRINIGSLMYFDPQAFNIGFAGYGTLSMIYFSEGWTAPTYFGFSHLIYLGIDEYTFFRCRDVNSGDLWNPPQDYPYQNEGGV